MQRSSFIPNRTWLNKRSRAPAYTSHLVTVPAGCNLLACLTFFGCSPVTRVELEMNLGVKVVAYWHGDQVIWAINTCLLLRRAYVPAMLYTNCMKDCGTT